LLEICGDDASGSDIEIGGDDSGTDFRQRRQRVACREDRQRP
jgi:hypothetical protein